MARAEAGRHCTVQSVAPPWVGCSAFMHLNHLGDGGVLTHVCPTSTKEKIRSDLSIYSSPPRTLTKLPVNWLNRTSLKRVEGGE